MSILVVFMVLPSVTGPLEKNNSLTDTAFTSYERTCKSLLLIILIHTSVYVQLLSGGSLHCTLVGYVRCTRPIRSTSLIMCVDLASKKIHHACQQTIGAVRPPITYLQVWESMYTSESTAGRVIILRCAR